MPKEKSNNVQTQEFMTNRYPTTEQLKARFKKNDHLLIMGFAASSAFLAPIKSEDIDIWGLNGLDKLIPGNYTLMFDIHKPGVIADRLDKIRESSAHYLLGLPHPDIPNTLAMPFQEITDTFGLNYFTCTFSWQMALAILFGYKVIDVFGVDMSQDKEYAYERPCAEYWIGFARGAGRIVRIPDTSALCSNPFIYGITEVNAQPWERVDKLVKQRISLMENQQKLAELNRARAEGALSMLKYIETALHENLRIFDIINRPSSAATDKVGGEPQEFPEPLQADQMLDNAKRAVIDNLIPMTTQGEELDK
jgi:hypothetical protein